VRVQALEERAQAAACCADEVIRQRGAGIGWLVLRS
jgi:hypothetical protein